VSAVDLPLQAEAEVDARPKPDDERFWSVTTIIKATGSDEGLINWSAQRTAQVALESEKVWQAIRESDGDDAAVKWLADARFKPPRGQRTATKLGSAVHAAIETLVVTGAPPAMGTPLGPELGLMDDEIIPYLASFDLFLDRFQPSFEAAELTVYNPSYRYAGTADGIAVVSGTTALIDYKTARDSWDARGNRKKPWADVGLQLAAYRHAEFAAVWRARRFEQYSRRYYLLNPEERAMALPMPKTDGGLVIHITPEHCDVYPVECDDEIFEAFLYSIEAARWSYTTSKRVIGDPIALLDRKGR
jgi:hypothetical protein